MRSTGISPLPTRLSDWPKNFVGRGEEAAGHIEDALRLSPRDTAVYLWRTFKGSVKVFLAKNEEAVGELRRAIEANRNFSAAYFYLAVALADWVASTKRGSKQERGYPSIPFGFLTTEANAVVAPIYPKAMPVILTTEAEVDLWLSADAPKRSNCNGPCPTTF